MGVGGGGYAFPKSTPNAEHLWETEAEQPEADGLSSQLIESSSFFAPGSSGSSPARRGGPNASRSLGMPAREEPLGLWVIEDPTDLWVIGQLEWSPGERV